MKKYSISLLTVLFAVHLAQAQYAPQAGIAGSTAVAAGSSQIAAWATNCVVQRGFMDIAQPSLGQVAAGDAANATGAANNSIVSLGDSGVAVLSFAVPIVNGSGPDFAVFENGFVNGADPEEAFLELAFVEVSSDGVNFFRFAAQSATQTDTQIPGAGVYMNARTVHNLAGKYRSGFGTPFDLEELTGTQGLDVNHITHVRLVDVIGALGEHTSLDDSGRVINDPYPTNFPTGGFDLDAVGVINQSTTGVEGVSPRALAVFPNPATDELFVSTKGIVNVVLTDATGKIYYSGKVSAAQPIPVRQLAKGVYIVHISNENGEVWTQRVVKL